MPFYNLNFRDFKWELLGKLLYIQFYIRLYGIVNLLARFRRFPESKTEISVLFQLFIFWLLYSHSTHQWAKSSCLQCSPQLFQAGKISFLMLWKGKHTYIKPGLAKWRGHPQSPVQSSSWCYFLQIQPSLKECKKPESPTGYSLSKALNITDIPANYITSDFQPLNAHTDCISQGQVQTLCQDMKQRILKKQQWTGWKYSKKYQQENCTVKNAAQTKTCFGYQRV